MRAWERCLRRDSEAFTDFLQWLDEMADRELRKLLTVGASQHDYQRGVHDGIRAVHFQAAANDREERERALHAAREEGR